MSTWQPIETAPRDGRLILVFDRRTGSPRAGCRRGRGSMVAWYDLGSWQSHELDSPWGGSYCPTPTHWMPLPEPPEDT